MAGAAGQFGEYRLGERLASGAIADVFVADAADGAGPTVVLKIFHKVDVEELPVLAGRAQLIDTVNCDLLVLPRTWGVVDRKVFIARPAQPAVDLARLLKEVKQRQTAVSVEVALAIVVDLLIALRALHGVRSPSGGPVYHGDLCAAHVLIDGDGITRLIGAESPRRSAGPSQRLDVAGASALLYEVLNAGSPRRLPAAEQGVQSVLRAQFEPLFLQGLGLAADESLLGAADFLTALKVQIDLAGISPQRRTLAEWARTFGALRPDPSQIKAAPTGGDGGKPAPVDFGAVTMPDARQPLVHPQPVTQPSLSPFSTPPAGDGPAEATTPDLPMPAEALQPPPLPTRNRRPAPEPAPRQDAPPPAKASAPPTKPARPAAAARSAQPATVPLRAAFDTAPTQPSPAAAPAPVAPPPQPATPPPMPYQPPLPGRLVSAPAPAPAPAPAVPVAQVPGLAERALDASGELVPTARSAFVPADTMPSPSAAQGPVSRPSFRPSTAFEPDPRRLGEILVAMRATSPAQIDQALEIKRQRGGHLGDLLVQAGAVSEEDIATARGRQAGVPTIGAEKLTALKVSDQLLSALPEVYASAKRVLPVAYDPAQKCVTLLVADPRDASAITEARVLIAAQHAEIWAAPRGALEETIRRLYAARGQEITGDAGDLLLLATANQTLAGSLKVRLVAEGFSVRHVTDGQVARDALEAGGVRGIVTELALPKVDGYNLILTTRSRDEYRDIPIFVFSSRADDYHMSKALELGADDFLPMPLNVDFLVSKLRRSIVRKPAAAAPAPQQQGGVGGSLKEMPLPEIVQTLEIGRKTATVEISFVDGLTGRIVFVDGQVVSAAAADKEGEPAFYALASPREGSFHISYGQAEGARNINNTTTFLLLEAMRRVDESR